MAIPTSAFMQLRTDAKSGITVEVYPSTVSGLAVEVQAATVNSTASSNWRSVILQPSSVGSLRYRWQFPDSTRLVYMRARHPSQPGYSAGPFTDTLSARTRRRMEIFRPYMPQMTYQGNVEIPSGADVFVSSGKTVKVGTQITTGTVTKTFRIGAHDLVPTLIGSTSLPGAQYEDAYLQPINPSTSVSTNVRTTIILPRGVVLTNVTGRCFRETTSDLMQLRLFRVNSTGGTVTLASSTQSSTGWANVSVNTTETVGSSFGYSARLTLRGNAAAANARVAWLDVTYRVGEYIDSI